MSPHAGGVTQRPAVQVSPSPQVASPQQGWSAWPQATQLAPMQRAPWRQLPPAQHASPGLPQFSARSQIPSRHTPPSQHSAFVSQSPPTSTQQRPLLQP